MLVRVKHVLAGGADLQYKYSGICDELHHKLQSNSEGIEDISLGSNDSYHVEFESSYSMSLPPGASAKHSSSVSTVGLG